MTKRKVLAICGSASDNSSNLKVLQRIGDLTIEVFDLEIFQSLKDLPHFNPALTDNNIPAHIVEIRNQISGSDGVIICSPEYIFSIPAGLKNLFEWCVSTTVFSQKPVGLITASARGTKAHEELQLVMRTLDADFPVETTLLIQGIKGMVSRDSNVLNSATEDKLVRFIEAFKNLLETRKGDF